jgi:Mrp family chromosome partitioning ATPase
MNHFSEPDADDETRLASRRTDLQPIDVSRPRSWTLSVARHQSAFVQLYYAVEARRTDQASIVVQFIAPSGGVGTTTVASGYARVAAAAQSRSVLYIDCSGSSTGASLLAEPPSLDETYRSKRRIRESVVPASGPDNLGWARLSSGPQPLLKVSGERLQMILDQLRTQTAIIVLDCPAATSPDAVALTRFCDGTVLVASRGCTRESEIQQARTLIERLGGQVWGVVLNHDSANSLEPVIRAR